MTAKRKDIPEPARPICMCGNPGAFHVQIEVTQLVLDRDAGMASRPYWTPKYRTGSRIESIMCQSCVRSNVKLQVTASAHLEKAAESP
jgi:hypothetical protein